MAEVKSPFGSQLGDAIERAMAAAVTKATEKDGVKDPEEIRRRMLAARQEVVASHERHLAAVAAKAKSSAEASVGAKA